MQHNLNVNTPGTDLLEAGAKAVSLEKKPLETKMDDAVANTVTLSRIQVEGSIECLDVGIARLTRLIDALDQIGDVSDKCLQELGSIKECMRDARGPLTTVV